MIFPECAGWIARSTLGKKERSVSLSNNIPSRYSWSYKGVSFDWYRLTEILGLKSQPQIHAIKKLIRAGQSVKSTEQDINEAIDALNRWKEMLKEDEANS